MDEVQIIQGRRVGPVELEQVRQLLAGHPDWSRRRLSQELAALWHWRNGVGQLKDMAARTLLLKLEQRGWLTLPARRQTPFNRMRPPPPALEVVAPPPFSTPLSALLPLAITEVSARADTSQRARFAALLRQHHYLGHRGAVGENLQYLVCASHERV